MKHEKFLSGLTLQQLCALACQNGHKAWRTDSRVKLLQVLNKLEFLKGVDNADES